MKSKNDRYVIPKHELEQAYNTLTNQEKALLQRTGATTTHQIQCHNLLTLFCAANRIRSFAVAQRGTIQTIHGREFLSEA